MALYRSRFFKQEMINERCVKEYCCEDISQIENYEKAIVDKTQTWECHHRLEIQGKFTNSPKLLKKCGLYDSVPAWQLIFLTCSEHRRLHTLGENNPMYGSLGGMYGKHHSAEIKEKISKAIRGENNPMYGKHHSTKTRQKLSVAAYTAHLGKHYWNNGIICKMSKECPGPEWKKGRL